MTDVHTEVRLHVEAEAPEGLTYIDCGHCGGRNKLLVGRFDDGGYFYKCLRATCPTSGSIGGTYRAPEAGDESRGTMRRTYDHWRDENFHALPFREADRLVYRYKIRRKDIDTYCAGVMRDGRYVLPIYRPTGRISGYMARSVSSLVTKALVRPFDQDSPLCSWYGLSQARDSDSLVIVEDQASAARISKRLPSIALLGTTISEAGFIELRKHWRGRICVALDNDATVEGQNLTRQLPGGWWYPLTGPDVKDMTSPEFNEFIRDVR